MITEQAAQGDVLNTSRQRQAVLSQTEPRSTMASS